MVLALARFNQIQVGLDPQEMSTRYQATIDMAAYAERAGVSMITLEEHHGTDHGWSPSPLITAGLIFGRCSTIGVTVSALLVPLHEPLRVAEDIAILDLASGGRLVVVAGLGYRPEEYAAHGRSWTERGKVFDDALDVLLQAWTGEPFEYRGTTVRVTPRPLTQPHPALFVGGSSKPAARRAARLGLPLQTAAYLPELEAYYYEQCEAHGTKGFCIMPGAETAMLFVSEDPDRTWAQLGHHFLHEASTYAKWQTSDIHSAVHSTATNPEELRAEGIYQVVTPAELLARATAQSVFVVHPLVGGMPVDRGWECLELFGGVLARLDENAF